MPTMILASQACNYEVLRAGVQSMKKGKLKVFKEDTSFEEMLC